MTTSMARKSDRQLRDELDILNKKNNELNEKRIRAQTEIDRAKKEKEELEAQLLKEFGTADLKRLGEILKEREANNEKGLKEYEEGLRQLSQEVDAILMKLSEIK